jgi:protein-tyrosine phosphatase
VLDLSAELPVLLPGKVYRSLPLLDLVTPDTEACRQGAELIEQLHRHGPLLVCCALGYSRSATLVAAWLLQSGRASSVEQAIELIRAARPQIVLGEAQRLALQGLLQPSAVLEVAHGL